MIAASSFSGLNGAVWGYDLARHDGLSDGSTKTLMTRRRSDGSRSSVPGRTPARGGGGLVRDGGVAALPLATGLARDLRDKDVTISGPTSVWSAIALSIAEDRERDSSLFIEDVGHEVAGDTPAERENALHARMEHIVDSVVLCGEDQGVKYKEIFVGFKTEWVPEGYVGCGLTCAPYVVLARKAVRTPPASCSTCRCLSGSASSPWRRHLLSQRSGPMTSRSVLDRSAFPILVVAGPERERLAG